MDDDPMIMTKGSQIDMVLLLTRGTRCFLTKIYDRRGSENQPKIDIVIDVEKWPHLTVYMWLLEQMILANHL